MLKWLILKQLSQLIHNQIVMLKVLILNALHKLGKMDNCLNISTLRVTA